LFDANIAAAAAVVEDSDDDVEWPALSQLTRPA
jgi:hypothetical protein